MALRTFYYDKLKVAAKGLKFQPNDYIFQATFHELTDSSVCHTPIF